MPNFASQAKPTPKENHILEVDHCSSILPVSLTGLGNPVDPEEWMYMTMSSALGSWCALG